MKIPF
jgi:hypothetical protein